MSKHLNSHNKIFGSIVFVQLGVLPETLSSGRTSNKKVRI